MEANKTFDSIIKAVRSACEVLQRAHFTALCENKLLNTNNWRKMNGLPMIRRRHLKGDK